MTNFILMQGFFSITIYVFNAYLLIIFLGEIYENEKNQ